MGESLACFLSVSTHCCCSVLDVHETTRLSIMLPIISNIFVSNIAVPVETFFFL